MMKLLSPLSNGSQRTEGEGFSNSGQQSAVSGEQQSFERIPLMRLIGQIGATYLVAEGPDGLYLIDQHAAHERVLFEKLMAQHDLQKIPSQSLLTPAVVTIPPQSAQLLITQLPTLQHFGFDVEEFGPNTFQVRAMPALFTGSDPSVGLRALVEDFEEDETPLQNEIEARARGTRLQADGGQRRAGVNQRGTARASHRSRSL